MSITPEQRQTIRQMASNCCEYCHTAEMDHLSTFQIDHIIPRKHGGTDDTENLCLACIKCNGYKGPNVAALDPLTGAATKLFDPRHQPWQDHFRVNDDATIQGLSPEGRTTIAVLRINEPSRIQSRQELAEFGLFPCDTLD